MTQTMILVIQSVGFGRVNDLALFFFSFSLEVEDDFQKPKNPDPYGVFIGISYQTLSYLI